MKRKIYIFILLGLFACGDDEKANRSPVAHFEFADGIDRILLDGEVSSDPDNDPLSYTWTSSDGSVVFKNPAAGESFFKIPERESASQVDVTLTVSDGKFENVKTRTVDVPAFSIVRSYGLGKSLSSETSNDVDYGWYIDQANTGEHSLLNCGPASVTMAIKWFDKDFAGTAEDARNTYHPSGGWWYTVDIIGYLNKFNVNNRTISLDKISNLKDELDAGNIMILCLDMFYVDYSLDEEYHVNKFYETNTAEWGHFIVVKGYKEVDGKIFYETYDPYSFYRSYRSRDLKGKNRYYSSANLDAATNIWWDYAVVVEPAGSPGGRKGIDVTKIVHMPGR